MTTPSDEPAEHPTEPTPAQSATPAPEPAPAPNPAPPAAQYAHADPTFAPVARPPRTPWVNPAKRAQVAIASAAAAIVLLGGGLVTGFAVGHHRGERVEQGRNMFEQRGGPIGPGMRMNPGDGYGPNGAFPGPNRMFPGRNAPGNPLPSPSPSSSK